MSSERHYRIDTKTVSHERFDDELIAINFDSGNYYSLDSVAADIWSLLLNPMTLEQLADEMEARYRASREEITEAVRRFLGELAAEKLVVTAEASGDDVGDLKADAAPGASPVGDDGDRGEFRAPVLQKYDDMQNLLLLDPIHEVDEGGWPATKATDRGDV